MNRTVRRKSFGCIIIAVALLAWSWLPAFGEPITSVTDLNHFRDTRSLNDVGIKQGDTAQFGAQVVPNDAAGTRFFATQGAVRMPPGSGTTMPCGAFTTNPNFCASSHVFDDPPLAGAWSLTFVNGTDSRTEVTPALTNSAVAAPAPFPVSVTITGSGSNPTLAWTVPGGFTPHAIRVQVFAKNQKNSQGVADIIFSDTFAGNVTSFTVPDSANLTDNTPYVLNIQLIETRTGAASTGNPNANISKRSSSFFDFTPLPAGAPPAVMLPTVGPAPDPGTGLGPTYEFRVEGIVPGGKIFIDPYLAIGYDYAIGAGNPNFASVLLPAIQSEPFLLSFAGEPNGVPVLLPAGQEYFFPAGGVDHFSVRGITLSAKLDPGNVTAFITGLTFTGSGRFTGTMTPIIVEVPSVPEPITVPIDIRPLIRWNLILRQSPLSVPVAILSSPTFDAPAQVDPGTLTFGRTGDEPSLHFCESHPLDVSRDGKKDLVCFFHIRTAAFEKGDTEGVLKGKTISGIPIVGSDSVVILGW
jgi:hypothetical protein